MRYIVAYMKVITPGPDSIGAYVRSIVAYRRLILVFARQELTAMYVQTRLGILWAIIKPLLTLAVFTIIFRFFLQVSTSSPYYLYAFAGMLSWNLFSQIAINASTAIVHKQNVIRKMYFPKLVLVFSKVLIALAEFLISLAVMCVCLLWEHILPGINWLALPVFVLLNIVCGLSIAVWMNALNIRFRDLYQLVPTALSIGVWITPVFYPTSIIPSQYNFFVYANPMAGIIKGYRYALLNEPFPETQYWYAIGITVLMAVAGLWYFSRVEDQMADSA